MMRRLSVLTVTVLCACGGGDLTTTTGPLTRTTHVTHLSSNLVGSYALGPDTAQGIAGTPGRFGHLTIHADGTFDASFAPGGCIMFGGSGHWVPFFDGGQLAVDEGEWLSNPDSNEPVRTLMISPSDDGVTVMADGHAQHWQLTRAGE